jgi:hypothetical protein
MLPVVHQDMPVPTLQLPMSEVVVAIPTPWEGYNANNFKSLPRAQISAA